MQAQPKEPQFRFGVRQDAQAPYRNSKLELVWSGTCTSDNCWYLQQHIVRTLHTKAAQEYVRLRLLMEIKPAHGRHV